MLEEQVEIIVRSWTEERFDFSGQYYTLKGQRARPQPLQKPHLPLVIGGNAKPRSAALAARFAQEYNVAFSSLELCKERLDTVRQACVAIGRDPETMAGSLFSVVVLGDSESEIAERHRRAAELTGNPPAVQETWLSGTVEQVAGRLQDFKRAGISRFYFKQADRQDFEAIKLLGRLAQAVS